VPRRPLRDGRCGSELVIDAVEFIAQCGHCFLPLYAFDPRRACGRTGRTSSDTRRFADAAVEARGCEETALPLQQRVQYYAECLQEARDRVPRLSEPCRDESAEVARTFGELQFFNVS
jgi:hypothetical protein